MTILQNNTDRYHVLESKIKTIKQQYSINVCSYSPYSNNVESDMNI